MIQPFLKDDDFLADIRRARREPERLHAWWLGQSGFLIDCKSSYLLMDPYLSDSLTAKYAATDKPHVRMTERVVAPERLAFVDIVTSSHNHTDHLDAATIRPILDANPALAIVVPAANREFAAQRLGVPGERLTPINRETPVHLDPFTLHAVPAAHEQIETDEKGRLRHIGLVVRVGSWTLYHAGDTISYPGMAGMLAGWKVDLAFLPINGRSPSRRVPGNLSGAEAAGLAADMRARLVVPCHYDMFEFNTASPDEFVAESNRLGVNHRILRQGERLSLRPR